MRIYRKEADEVQLIAFPDEHVHKGDYFVIEDQAQSRGLLVQAIDLQYANVPGDVSVLEINCLDKKSPRLSLVFDDEIVALVNMLVRESDELDFIRFLPVNPHLRHVPTRS